MSRQIWISEDPFSGLAESVVTSNILNIRDAFDIIVSWRTTSGATSRNTLQFYVAAPDRTEGQNVTFIEGRWSNWTTFGQTAPTPPSSSTIISPVLGAGYLRITRQVAGAPSQTSFDIHVARFING